MIFAQVLNGTVQNVILLNDASLIPLFSKGYDSFIDVTNIPQYPSPGDSYDGKNFTPAKVDYVAALNQDLSNIDSQSQQALSDAQQADPTVVPLIQQVDQSDQQIEQQVTVDNKSVVQQQANQAKLP